MISNFSKRPFFFKHVVLSDNVWNIISAYAPQVGCDNDTTHGIGYNKMKLLYKEKLVLAGDINGHVGESRIGFERWHGGFSVGEIIEGGDKCFYIWPKLLTLQ